MKLAVFGRYAVVPSIKLQSFHCSFQVCALRVTERARARILKSGGELMTFDQLALRSPKGKNTVLLQGAYKKKIMQHMLFAYQKLIATS